MSSSEGAVFVMLGGEGRVLVCFSMSWFAGDACGVDGNVAGGCGGCREVDRGAAKREDAVGVNRGAVRERACRRRTYRRSFARRIGCCRFAGEGSEGFPLLSRKPRCTLCRAWATGGVFSLATEVRPTEARRFPNGVRTSGCAVRRVFGPYRTAGSRAIGASEMGEDNRSESVRTVWCKRGSRAVSLCGHSSPGGTPRRARKWWPG